MSKFYIRFALSPQWAAFGGLERPMPCSDLRIRIIAAKLVLEKLRLAHRMLTERTSKDGGRVMAQSEEAEAVACTSNRRSWLGSHADQPGARFTNRLPACNGKKYRQTP